MEVSDAYRYKLSIGYQRSKNWDKGAGSLHDETLGKQPCSSPAR